MNNLKNETKIVDLLERDGVDVKAKEEVVIKKPYTLRKLNSKDISPMIKVLKKIELKRFKKVVEEINLMDIVSTKTTEENEEIKENEKDKVDEISEKSNTLMQLGETLIFEAIPILLDSIDNAITEVNELLAGVANLTIEEVENMDLDIYFNLIYDFITKPEFAGFIKAVSKLIK